jgi:hypothetical protein
MKIYLFIFGCAQKIYKYFFNRLKDNQIYYINTMKLTPVKAPIIKDLGNVKSTQITLAPPEGKLLTYSQIRDYCKQVEKDLPKGSKMVVRGENIMRFTTLYSTYGKKWDTDEAYDEYLNAAVQESDKFKVFYNFTISIKESKNKA